LSGCETTGGAQPTIQLEVRVPVVPKVLRSCGVKPHWKKLESPTQKHVATFVNKLGEWGDACADNLESVDGILTQAEKDAAVFNEKQKRTP
jgi:hypothetical protein